MRVFVAGATGAVGRQLIPLLVGLGHHVIAITRSPGRLPALERHGAHGVVADVFDRAALAAVVREAAPDAIVHQLTDLSGGSSQANARLRREGTRNLVDAARAAGVRRIVGQSIAWAYEGGQGPADESVALDTGAPEPRATTIDGVVALESSLAELPEHVILRYGTLHGPGTWYAPGGLVGRTLADSHPAAAAVTSFLHVRDAATAAVLALEWPSGTVNVVDDHPARAERWVPVVAAALGVPAPALGSAAEPWERGASNLHARRDLGWEPLHPDWRAEF